MFINNSETFYQIVNTEYEKAITKIIVQIINPNIQFLTQLHDILSSNSKQVKEVNLEYSTEQLTLKYFSIEDNHKAIQYITKFLFVSPTLQETNTLKREHTSAPRSQASKLQRAPESTLLAYGAKATTEASICTEKVLRRSCMVMTGRQHGKLLRRRTASPWKSTIQHTECTQSAQDCKRSRDHLQLEQKLQVHA